MRVYALVFALLCSASLSFAQLSADSVKSIGIQLYKADATIPILDGRQKSKEDGLIFDTVAEVFKGRFKDVKLLVVIYRGNFYYSHGANVLPRLYAINAKTGQRLQLRTLSQFNELINSSKSGISRLDQAYLYQFICFDILKNGQYGLSSPAGYSTVLQQKSEFAKDPLLAGFFPSMQGALVTRRMFSQQEMDANIGQSLPGEIVMYSFKPYPKTSGSEYTYKFVFTFNVDGELEAPKVVMYQ